MKKYQLVLLFILIGCIRNTEMNNIDGFANIIFVSKLSNISQKNRIVVLGNDWYKIQYRFVIDKTSWIVGKKIYDTYVIINSIKYKLSDLLIETDIDLKKGKNRESIKINKTSILAVNMANSEVYGNISMSLHEEYIYVTIAWVNLKFGLYSFDNIVNNKTMTNLNPELIIGIGETGRL